MLCFRKFPVAKKFLDKGGGSIKIYRRKPFVSQCRKISYGRPSVLCFRKFPVAKKFMDKGWGEYQDFPSKIFCLTVPKNFVVETFCAVFQKISGNEKVYGYEGRGSIKIFRRNFFVSQCRKIS